MAENEKPFPGSPIPQNQPDKAKEDERRRGGQPSPEVRDERTGEREKSKET